MALASLVALVLIGVVTAFQLALAVGAPWGVAAYGGIRRGVLPVGLRINSLVFAAAIYPLVALYLLDASGRRAFDWLPGSRTFVMWVFVAFFVVGGLANLASRSKPERFWAPVAFALAVCCGVIALG